MNPFHGERGLKVLLVWVSLEIFLEPDYRNADELALPSPDDRAFLRLHGIVRLPRLAHRDVQDVAFSVIFYVEFLRLQDYSFQITSPLIFFKSEVK